MKTQDIKTSNAKAYHRTIADLLPGLPVIGFSPYDSYGIEIGIAQRLLVFYQQLGEANVNGIYNVTTANAVQQIQIEQGLPQQEGIIDPGTWSTLAGLAVAALTPTPPILHLPIDEIVDNYPNTLPELSQVYPTDPNPYLSVAVLQSLLTLYGYLQPDASGDNPVDGLFGIGTDMAVKIFQNDISISVDGIVGPRTWAALANFADVPDLI